MERRLKFPPLPLLRLGLAFFVIAAAGYGKTCVEGYLELATGWRRDLGIYLTPESRYKMGQAYELDAIPAWAKPNVTFEVYLKARLASLAKADRDSLLANLENEHLTVSRLPTEAEQAKGDTTGHFIYDEATLDFVRIETVFPQPWRGSVLEMVTKVHEVEHAIQYQAMAKVLKEYLAAGGNRSRLTREEEDELRFLTEAFAMEAEWNYTSGLPQSVREATLAQLRTDTALHPRIRQHFIRTFENAGASLPAYISGEHAAGRYSRDYFDAFTKSVRAIERNGRLNRIMIAMGFSATGGAISGTAIQDYCYRYQASPHFNPNNTFYREICRLLPDVRETEKTVSPL